MALLACFVVSGILHAEPFDYTTFLEVRLISTPCAGVPSRPLIPFFLCDLSPSVSPSLVSNSVKAAPYAMVNTGGRNVKSSRKGLTTSGSRWGPT